MEVIRTIEDIKRVPDGIVTVGTFDGIHLAHQAILARVISYAEEHSLKSSVVTFHPHPRLVVKKADGLRVELLSPIEEKIKLLGPYNIDRLIVIPFTEKFSQISPGNFISEVLCERIGLRNLVIGYDHGFGKNRSGNLELLEKYREKCGFDVDVVESISNEQGVISSTLVRKLLKAGDVIFAAECLGRLYQLMGKVVKGDGRGRQLDYPTANIGIPDQNKCLPENGVYIVKVLLKKETLNGVMNIGRRPTFGKTEISPEVHIFDFDRDIYGEDIEVHFCSRVRGETKFESAEELTDQIKKDVSFARNYFVKN